MLEILKLIDCNQSSIFSRDEDCNKVQVIFSQTIMIIMFLIANILIYKSSMSCV